MQAATRQGHLFDGVLKNANDGFHEGPTPAQMEAKARPRLRALLEEAQAAAAMPWSAQDVRVNASLFHNMANWLPAAERDALRAAFVAELDRLQAASRRTG